MQNPKSLPMVPLDDHRAWLLAPEEATTQFFPMQVRLRATATTTLPHHHAGMICGLIKAALSTSTPDGILIDYPEQCRTQLFADETYHFGVNLIASSATSAREALENLVNGLQKIGREGAPARTGLRGNFHVDEVFSLIDGTIPTSEPVPVNARHIELQIHEARSFREVELLFHTPLHCKRPVPLRNGDSACLDREVFPADVFLRRAAKRCSDLGLLKAIPEVLPHHVTVVENRLVWLDLKYGEDRTPLSGAVGRITLELHEPELVEILVRAQYARVGEKTRFGFGGFTIQGLTSPTKLASRAASLVALAVRSAESASAADDQKLEAGRLLVLAEQVLSGTYEPQPVNRIILPADGPDGSPRLLSVPHAEDRALQSCVLQQIADALDGFFEESSHAYRRKLGRHTAAKRLQAAYRDGFHWAVRSDFHRFFDSVDHATLQDRLEAYLADPQLTGLLMKWVTSGSPWPGRGLPTGSPLSPALANLFLDRFDEQIAAEGGRLVRYADDFLILFRKPEDAERLFRHAEQSARSVRLHLNEQKTKFLDLREPFEFLGFRFHKVDDWEVVEGKPPRHVDDLGWEDAPKPVAVAPDSPLLPGESAASSSAATGLHIAGPDVAWVGIEKDNFIIRYRDRGQSDSVIPVQRVEDLVLIGQPTLADSLWKQRSALPPTLWLADRMGRLGTLVQPAETADNAPLLIAQVQASLDGSRSLQIARQLVAAKLSNYADLAGAASMKLSGDGGVLTLRNHAANAMKAKTVEELLGIEGAGAAAWYRTLHQRINPQFKFPKRVAPSAEDPVNAMLNLGFTWLYRLTQLLLIRQTLSPAIGFLHQPRPGHAALASDVMEPFRHLVDRAVITATFALKPGDFKKMSEGPFRLHMTPHAVRTFLKILHTGMFQPCVGTGQTEARPYRQQLGTTIRSLHRHLLTTSTDFRPFRHTPE